MATTRDKRDKLRLIYASIGQADDAPLGKRLLKLLADCDEAIADGGWISSTSGASGSTSLQVLQDYSPAYAKQVAGELCDLYDKAKAFLGKDATDEQVYTQMMGFGIRSGPRLLDKVKGTLRIRSDYSFIVRG